MRKILLKTVSAAALIATSVYADLPSDEITFPRDFGGHLSNTSYENLNIFESWYYAGTLQAEDSTDLSYTCAVFGAEMPLPTGEVVNAHWAYMIVIDQDRSIVYNGNAGFDNSTVSYSNTELDLNYNDQVKLKSYFNYIEQVNCKVADQASGEELELSLYIHPTNEHLLYPNEIGVFEKPGEGNWRAYSKPNQPTSGTVTIGSKKYDINPGKSTTWATHMWGDNYPSVGWDWFTVTLENGLNAICYFHADSDRNIIDGSVTLNMPDGTSRSFGMDDIVYDKVNYWTSPKYGQTFPLNYSVTIPEMGLSMVIDAKFAEQEVSGMFDGIANVSATLNDEKLKGSGAININIME